jgi:hypothetical protein
VGPERNPGHARGHYDVGVLATMNIIDLDGPVRAVPALIVAMLLD